MPLFTRASGFFGSIPWFNFTSTQVKDCILSQTKHRLQCKLWQTRAEQSCHCFTFKLDASLKHGCDNMQSLEITPRSLLFYLWFVIQQKIISKSPHISQRSFLCGGSDKQQKNRQWQQEEKEKKRDVTHHQVKEDEAVTWLRVEQECDSCERHFSTQCACSVGKSSSTDCAIQSHFKGTVHPKWQFCHHGIQKKQNIPAASRGGIKNKKTTT